MSPVVCCLDYTAILLESGYAVRLEDGVQGFRQSEVCRKAESELILILRREGDSGSGLNCPLLTDSTA